MTEGSHEHWMSQALSLADEAAAKDEVPIGAVLVVNDELISQGYNLRESSGKTTDHAEIIALEKYNAHSGQWRLPPGTCLYVTVEPCVMCSAALISARIDQIYYGCPDTKLAALGLIQPHIEVGVFDHTPSVIQGGVLGESCAERLSSFFKAKRARKAVMYPSCTH